jgi:AraC family transcriptional regulator
VSKNNPLRHFYGTSLKRFETDGITLVESSYRPSQRNPRHAHEDPTFCLVLQGAFTELHNGRATTCKPSTLLFYPPGESHADHFQLLGGRCFIVEVKPFWVDRLREHSAHLNQAAHFQGGRLVSIAMKLYQEFRLLDELSPLLIESLALEMLAVSSRCIKQFSDRTPRPLQNAREMIQAHFSERLTLAGIARTVGLHPVYLASEFRKQYGCTVGEYVRQLRIEFACQQLSQSRETLANIAAAAGFFDQSHFTRTFKDAMGMTPSECRSAFRSQ